MASAANQTPWMCIFLLQSKKTCWMAQNFLRNSKRWKHVRSTCLFCFWSQIPDLSIEPTWKNRVLQKKSVNVCMGFLLKICLIIINSGPSKMKVREDIFWLLESTNNFEVTPQENSLTLDSYTNSWTPVLKTSPLPTTPGFWDECSHFQILQFHLNGTLRRKITRSIKASKA